MILWHMNEFKKSAFLCSVNWQLPLTSCARWSDPVSNRRPLYGSVNKFAFTFAFLPANKNFIFILCPSRKLTMKLKPKRGETETERGKRKSNNSDTYVHATLKEWSAYKTKERNMTPYGIFMRELLHTHSYGYTHPLLICHTDTHAHCDTFPRQNIRNFAYAWWWRGWSRMARDRCHSVAHYICKIWHTNAINHNTAQNTPPIPPHHHTDTHTDTHAYNVIIISNAACSQNLRTRGNY